jgi:hypothetical protein
MMKTFLLLAVGSVVTAGALPSLPAKIILTVFVLMAVLSEAARRTPRFQEEKGSSTEGKIKQPDLPS